MKIESPLHAEHQLDQLAGQFEHWRQTRTHPGERFPQALWDQAVALAATLPPSRVAKQLRLRLTDLKKQMATPHAAPSVAPPTALVMVSFTYMRSEADRVWKGSPTVPLGNGLAVLCKHPRDILPRNLLL